MTAHDLLYKILDYTYIWSLPKNKNSEPAKARLAQIEALLEGFGLTKKYVSPLVQMTYFISGNKGGLDRAQHLNKITNLEYVLGGEFIHDREVGVNKELSERVLAKIGSLTPHMVEHINNRPVDIGWLFNNLLKFRQEIYKVSYPNEGMSEGFSAGLYYSFYLQGELKKNIKENLFEIDETLSLVLDPLKRDIKKEDMNYPDLDLESIDLKWKMDNY